MNNTSSASAILAMPALVGMLSFPLSAHASEGADLVAMAPLATPRVAPLAASQAAIPPAPAPAVAAPAARPATPAPSAIAAGPVWTDASGEWRQVGVASWYGGRRWQGRLTASGVRYDERLLTAAHASLPIGSQVRVTVAETGRSVVVTIIDRPGTRRRIIDLSRAAAGELGILRSGVAQVTITPA